MFGRACAALTRLCTALCAAGPLAVTVDDLPELDNDCLALLAVVLRRLSGAPIGLVATARAHLAEPNPAAEELLARLADAVELVPVELGTLSAAELAALVTPVLGAAPDGELAAELHRRADGNPFFATEIARSLVDGAAVTVAGGQSRLAVPPAEIQLTRGNAVLRRVLPLDPPARAVARALAVLRAVELGRLGLIAAVVALPEPVLAAAFDELVRAQVVTAGRGRPVPVRARHRRRRGVPGDRPGAAADAAPGGRRPGCCASGPRARRSTCWSWPGTSRPPPSRATRGRSRCSPRPPAGR